MYLFIFFFIMLRAMIADENTDKFVVVCQIVCELAMHATIMK
jgi:hypothetical protein